MAHANTSTKDWFGAPSCTRCGVPSLGVSLGVFIPGFQRASTKRHPDKDPASGGSEWAVDWQFPAVDWQSAALGWKGRARGGLLPLTAIY